MRLRARGKCIALQLSETHYLGGVRGRKGTKSAARACAIYNSSSMWLNKDVEMRTHNPAVRSLFTARALRSIFFVVPSGCGSGNLTRKNEAGALLLFSLAARELRKQRKESNQERKTVNRYFDITEAYAPRIRMAASNGTNRLRMNNRANKTTTYLILFSFVNVYINRT